MTARMAWIAAVAAVVGWAVGCRHCDSCGASNVPAGGSAYPTAVTKPSQARGVELASATMPASNRVTFAVPEMH